MHGTDTSYTFFIDLYVMELPYHAALMQEDVYSLLREEAVIWASAFCFGLEFTYRPPNKAHGVTAFTEWKPVALYPLYSPSVIITSLHYWDDLEKIRAEVLVVRSEELRVRRNHMFSTTLKRIQSKGQSHIINEAARSELLYSAAEDALSESLKAMGRFDDFGNHTGLVYLDEVLSYQLRHEKSWFTARFLVFWH